MTASPTLVVRDLEVVFPGRDHLTRVVDGVTLQIDEGERFGLIGETGAGKSITAWAALDLVPPPGRVSAGSVEFKGERITGAEDDHLRRIRGGGIGVVVQDPRTALNPVLCVEDQMVNALRAHREVPVADARETVNRALRSVGIADRGRVLRAYPHQLSGGQAQRVLIAMAFANRPALLIADEPTTGLDVTIQAEILDLMEQMVHEDRQSLWLITHDLGIVANYTERAAVMFAGQIIEHATTAELFANPLHPYTAGLVDAMVPRRTKRRPHGKVSGPPPDLHSRPAGCQFAYRCPVRQSHCTDSTPDLRELAPGHWVRCFVGDGAVLAKAGSGA